MNKKIIAALCALTICLSAAACGQTDSAEDAPAETTAAQSAPDPVTMATEAVPTEPVDLSKGLTDAMYERAVVSEGNKARLAKAMKKAATARTSLWALSAAPLLREAVPLTTTTAMPSFFTSTGWKNSLRAMLIL